MITFSIERFSDQREGVWYKLTVSLAGSTHEKTFDDLVKYFQASKSSVSNSLSFLLQNKIIDYKTYSADRKRYFYLTDSFFRVYFQKVLENVRELKEQSIRIVSARTPVHPAASEKILRWIENANVFQEFLETTLTEMKKDLI